MRPLAVWSLAALACFPGALLAAEPGPPKRPASQPPRKVYTFRQLLDRAKLIVVATVETTPPAADDGTQEPSQAGEGAGPREARRAWLRVSEILKGSEQRGVIPVESLGPPLPRGARAVWLLVRTDGAGRYLIDSKQCAYGVRHLAKVQLGLRDPSRINPRSYLRRADYEDARRLRALALARALGRARPTGAVRGLALDVFVVRNVLAAGRTLAVRFTLTNRTARPIHVRDSVDMNYIVRLTPLTREGRPAGEPVLIRQKGLGALGELGGGKADLDAMVLETDFHRIAPGRQLLRVIHLPPADHPELARAGFYEIATIYRSTSAGRPAGLEAWTGTLVSDPVPLVIRPSGRSPGKVPGPGQERVGREEGRP